MNFTSDIQWRLWPKNAADADQYLYSAAAKRSNLSCTSKSDTQEYYLLLLSFQNVILFIVIFFCLILLFYHIEAPTGRFTVLLL